MNEADFFEEISLIRKALKNKLDPMRYEHSLSVSFTSVCLAMRYGYDLHKAELAGLLHDCAKRFTEAEMRSRCEEAGILLTEDERKAPQVIHARYGAYLARKRYGIEDEEILSAIYYHTVGKADMSLLEAIVFTADYIETRRFKAQNLSEIRQLAFTDLNRCVYEIMKSTVEFLQSKQIYICKDSLDAYRFYQNMMQDSEK